MTSPRRLHRVEEARKAVVAQRIRLRHVVRQLPVGVEGVFGDDLDFRVLAPAFAQHVELRLARRSVDNVGRFVERHDSVAFVLRLQRHFASERTAVHAGLAQAADDVEALVASGEDGGKLVAPRLTRSLYVALQLSGDRVERRVEFVDEVAHGALAGVVVFGARAQHVGSAASTFLQRSRQSIGASLEGCGHVVVARQRIGVGRDGQPLRPLAMDVEQPLRKIALFLRAAQVVRSALHLVRRVGFALGLL